MAQKITESRADGRVQKSPLNRKRVYAFGQVLAGGLAQLAFRGHDVEDVVSDLKDHAEGLPESRQFVDPGPVQPCGESTYPARRRHQRGGLV